MQRSVCVSAGKTRTCMAIRSPGNECACTVWACTVDFSRTRHLARQHLDGLRALGGRGVSSGVDNRQHMSIPGAAPHSTLPDKPCAREPPSVPCVCPTPTEFASPSTRNLRWQIDSCLYRSSSQHITWAASSSSSPSRREIAKRLTPAAARSVPSTPSGTATSPLQPCTCAMRPLPPMSSYVANLALRLAHVEGMHAANPLHDAARRSPGECRPGSLNRPPLSSIIISTGVLLGVVVPIRIIPLVPRRAKVAKSLVPFTTSSNVTLLNVVFNYRGTLECMHACMHSCIQL